MSMPWFDANTFASLYGGIGGGVFGVLGGCIGTAAGVWAPRGKHRSLVLGAMYVVVVLGILQIVAGLAALLAHQPYGIYYPLLLLGLLSSVIVGTLIPVVRRRYSESEQRRLDAAALRSQ